MEKKGKFIAIEGIDGSGKSTQTHLLADRLKKEGVSVYPTFEPTDGPIGSLIRNIFSGRIDADHRTIAGLFVADRLDHILNTTNGILKKISEGYTVISDRYYFSSYAYQGAHMDMDWVIAANSQSAEILRPDLHVFIDVDPDLSMERMQKSRSSADMYETLDNLKRVRQNFFSAFEKQKEERVVIINGNRPLGEIHRDLWAIYSDL